MKERVVLVTGASRGIGKAIAEKFAQHGDRVFGTARQPESIKWAAGTLLALDVQEETSVAQCVATILSQAKRIDVLVNNAGITITGAIEELSLTQVKAVFETNFFGVVRMTQAVLWSDRKHRLGCQLFANAIPSGVCCHQACARWLDRDFGPRSSPFRDPCDPDPAGIFSHRHRSQFDHRIVH
jgi:NAD(P)-dependent dehydrogenase (short-subunit alcohol dehydrogenase family)